MTTAPAPNSLQRQRELALTVFKRITLPVPGLVYPRPKLKRHFHEVPADHKLAPGILCWSCATWGYTGLGESPEAAYIRWAQIAAPQTLDT